MYHQRLLIADKKPPNCKSILSYKGNIGIVLSFDCLRVLKLVVEEKFIVDETSSMLKPNWRSKEEE